VRERLVQRSERDFGDVTIPCERSGVFAEAPAAVWVAKEGRAEPRAVTTGLESPDRVEIREGLTGAERVIASGREGLYAGARVTDGSGPAPASSPAPDEQKDMPGMPGMKQPTEKPSTPKGGPHGGH